MCGRFTRTKSVEEVARIFQLPEPPAELSPRYNVAPTQQVAVVGMKPDGVTRGLTMLRWGLVREDWDLKGRPLVNLRAESIERTAGDLLESQRCLVVADGFIEWRQDRPGEDPHLFRLKSREPFAFAGLWNVLKKDGKPLGSCCFMTTDPNGVVSFLHNRMPVMLKPEEFALWLDPEAGTPDVLPLLDPYPPEEMEAIPLTRKVNSSRDDTPACLTPLAG
jgi:putative SOS response-associated peptidase YedK